MTQLSTQPGPIGVFDSGYGGLTILHAIRKQLPQYDYLYLGDNARAPYGPRSFDVVYDFTRQAVLTLFEKGCQLVILACNTASAKALRTIQQHDLPQIDPSRRVLGVIRPTAEIAGHLSQNRHIGVLATEGTIASNSYHIEIQKLFPDVKLSGIACPMWVPLIENNEANNDGADYFVHKYISQLLDADPDIDAVVLACTHYPILLPKIRKALPSNIRIIAQGEYVAKSLEDYMQRHPEMDMRCTKNGTCQFFTTENPEKFKGNAQLFLNEEVEAHHIDLSEK